MKEFYVEVFNPPCPNDEIQYKVWNTYPGDSLSPNLTHLYSVKAKTKREAIALLLSGKGNTLISPTKGKLVLAVPSNTQKE